MEIGARIASLRKEARLTQERLAEATDCGVGVIKKIETYQRKITAEEIVQLAEVLKVSCDYLLTGRTPGHTVIAQDLGLSALAIDELKKLNKENSLTLKLIEYLIINHRKLSDANKYIERAIAYQEYENANKKSDISIQGEMHVDIDDVIGSLVISANNVLYYQILDFVREEAYKNAKEDNP